MLAANRIKENATGTGSELVLTGAVAGYNRFSNVFTVPGAAAENEEFDGLGCRVLIEWDGGWEIDLAALDPVDGLSIHRIWQESSSLSPYGSSNTIDPLPAGAKTVSLVASAVALPNTSDVRVINNGGVLSRVTTDRVGCIVGPQRNWLWDRSVDIVSGLAELIITLPPGVLPENKGLIRATVGVNIPFGQKVIGVYEYIGSAAWGYTLVGGTLHHTGAAGPALTPIGNISGGLTFSCEFSGFTDGTCNVLVRLETIGL